jgi:hypothetical protein
MGLSGSLQQRGPHLAYDPAAAAAADAAVLAFLTAVFKLK